MASLPEKTDVEVVTDKIRLFVTEGEENVAPEGMPCADSAAATAAPLEDGEPTLVAAMEESVESKTDAAASSSSSQLPVSSGRQEESSESPTLTNAELQTSAGTIAPEMYAKGSISLFATMSLIAFMAFWPSMIMCPYLMPSGFWEYNLPQLLFSAGIYSAEIALIMGFLMAVMLPFFAYCESKDSKQPRFRGFKAIDLQMSKRQAWELCMAAAAKCKLQRAQEEQGELAIYLSQRATLDLRIEPVTENTCRLEIKRSFETGIPALFWKEELEQFISSYVGAGGLLAEQIEKYIKSHANLYAARELTPADYQEQINYSLPKKRFDNRLILAATLAFYPLMMFLYAQSPALLPSQARYWAGVDQPRALALYNQALDRNPHWLRMLWERADLQYQMHRNAAAEADYRAALAISPNNIALLYGLQGTLIQQNKLGELWAVDAHIASVFPDTADILNNRAWDLCLLGNPQTAIELCNRAIASDPAFDAAYGTRGYAYHLLGNDTQAAADYRTAIALDPNNRIDHFFLAQALTNLGMVSEAATERNIAQFMGLRDEEKALPPTFDNFTGDPPTLSDNLPSPDFE